MIGLRLNWYRYKYGMDRINVGDRIVDLVRNFSKVKVITFTWIIWDRYNSRDWYG